MTVSGVSVIVPTYDDAEHLPQALDSVLGQSISGVALEVVVVDSSSADSVRSLVDEYESNVRYEWMEPDGVAPARNRGIDLATHEVIGFCDADDYWHEDKLSRQLPLIEAGYDLVYSDEYLVSDGSVSRLSSLEIEDPDNHYIKHFREGGVGSRSVLVRRDCLLHERFDERFVVREDPHLWTRLFRECRVARVPEGLSYKRRRSESLTADRDRAFQMEMMEIDDLVDRYPELESYRSEREVNAKLQYAKTLLSDEDRPADARRVLSALIMDGHISARSVSLWMISAFPLMNEDTFRTIQKLRWRVRSSTILTQLRERFFGNKK